MKALLDGFTAGKTYVGAGIAQYYAVVRDFPMPVGFVWSIDLADETRSRADILWAWTHPDYLRRGVCTAILDHMLKEQVDVLSTWSGTKSGAALMRAFGFKWDRRLCIWTCTCADRRRAKKGRRHP